MANRFVLNETSYHGKGAIQEIANEVKGRGFKKCFVCSDPRSSEVRRDQEGDGRSGRRQDRL